MSDVWKDIWTSLRAVVPVIASTVALGLALLGSLWDPGIKVTIGLIWLAVVLFVLFVMVVMVVMVAIIATTIKMAFDARRAARGDLPRAVYVYAPTMAEGGSPTGQLP